MAFIPKQAIRLTAPYPIGVRKLPLMKRMATYKRYEDKLYHTDRICKRFPDFGE